MARERRDEGIDVLQDRNASWRFRDRRMQKHKQLHVISDAEIVLDTLVIRIAFNHTTTLVTSMRSSDDT